MRSAAESDDVGWPDPAAVEQRMLSARSWRASERYRSRRVAAPLTVATTTRYRRNTSWTEYPRSHYGGDRMEIGLYGLGRMGGNMVTRLVRGGHRVVAGNRSPGPVDEAKAGGAVGAYTIEEMAKQLKPPRVLWSMVPAGEVTDHTLDEFARYATKGDVLVDGGNSYFRDSMRRAQKYTALGFDFVDAGVSGGVWGLENGYCMMIGGEPRAVELLKPILDTLAPPNGWGTFGAGGRGHFA